LSPSCASGREPSVPELVDPDPVRASTLDPPNDPVPVRRPVVEMIESGHLLSRAHPLGSRSSSPGHPSRHESTPRPLGGHEQGPAALPSRRSTFMRPCPGGRPRTGASVSASASCRGRTTIAGISSRVHSLTVTSSAPTDQFQTAVCPDCSDSRNNQSQTCPLSRHRGRSRRVREQPDLGRSCVRE